MRRIPSILSLLLLLALPAAPALAQELGNRIPAGERIIFEPVDMPAPNEYRAASGEPNEEYWQNSASYDIDVTLDPATNTISGTETITYTNNSPDALEWLWLQLDQNLFDPDSRGAKLTPPTERFSGAFPEGGFDISRVAILRDGERVEPEFYTEWTEMRVALEEPLEGEGGTLQLRIDFSFVIPKYGADRMGRLDVDEGTVYEIAQWYPRMFVYDDRNGWNVMPYLGQGEFYLEYGDFDVEITVPREFIVVATGELQNPEEVLTEEQQQRLQRARTSAETIYIIPPDEVGDSDTRPPGAGALTWEFHAENVRDFAWAASQAFIWDAASWQDVLVMSVYPDEGIGEGEVVGWEQSTRMARHSIQFYSEFLDYEYPYPVAINVAGIVGGMEYPQIVFCSVEARGRALFGVTDHEFAHQWFPMIVGSDERRWAWMDEGLDTFINYYSALAYYGEAGARDMSERSRRAARLMTGTVHTPIMTYADRIPGDALGFAAYSKPGYGLMILREFVLGPELFDSAFQEYLDRWAYLHPKPADFFRTMENVAGEDLDWFWRGWFLSDKVLDQAILDVRVENDTTLVLIQSQAGMVLPVPLRITYENGETEPRLIPVEAFYTDNSFTEVIPGDEVASIVIDPAYILPDVDRHDNTWGADVSP